MNATKNNIGNNSTTRRKKTKTTAPTTKGIRRVDASNERQLGSSERPTEISSNLSTSDAFLKTCFIPKLKENDITVKQTKRKSAKIERDFYKSLSQLAKHYDVTTMPTKHFNYPYNISLALRDIETQLKTKSENWQSIRLIEKGSMTNLAIEERCNTGATLFYVPVVPLYQLLHNKVHRKAACLLLSVCAYLYRNADVPYYRLEDSYLYYNYEMLNDWLEQDEEIEDSHNSKKELQRAEIIGDMMGQKISNPKNLLFFKQRLKRFRPKDRFDKECLQLAEKAFKIYCDYPNESIFRNSHFNNAVKSEDIYEDNYYNEETVVAMDKYISFFAESDGVIYDNLMSCVNNEFNEYSETQEPMIIKTFDGSDLSDKTLDFENQLFKVLNELCRLLN
ncbi:hypothetical protein NAL32_10755 [Chryseobacterium sp. Ch-15]|uniref:Uncharacterized protein n=1 Tax=Chryseobacterium muglaense TaxID=2893752 RepID=A0A9Q3UWA3_9FLAO|nr:hypothetical protein [Chryseobacterium muglaense]MCC9036259.1 hypothetical protein [Chryseobacterium muglaense]MCM2554862.1 hypothetical protein [Chryseobacterium muglaense]